MANNGLITLHTDLTSLKYGSMPFGGDKPYVTKDIGEAPSSQVGLELQSRIDDTSRIAQMLVDKPGIKYLLHEAELQQIGVGQRIKKAQQGGKSLVGAVLQQAGSTLLTTAKIAASTLAQVPVNGTGTHFLKGFRTDTYLQPSGPGNISAFASFFGAGGVEGAPYALRGEIVPGVHETELSPSTSDYSPYSTTEDQVATNTTKGFNNVSNADTTYSQSSQSFYDPTTESLTSAGQSTFTNVVSDEATPRKKQEEEPDEFSNISTYLDREKKLPTFNKNVTKEYRLRLGDQGAAISDEKQAARKKSEYWFMSDTTNPTGSLEVDRINALAPNNGKVTGEREGRDLVKFRFHILTADGKEKVLYFRAYLDSFADNYSGQWNPVKYLGRAEDFQIYSGFQRKISLSFKIAAATRVEMKPLYQKMIWLASATAPTYADEGQFMRGTITKITVGDYIYELPGVLNSVNYTWNTEYPWEIAMLEPEGKQGDPEMQELPMVMDCSIDFTPIHTFTPTTGLNKFITAGTTPANTYI
ncbi:hypothetical protein UFOVP54_23 [uncultured Caudovirales phage]|uniref:Uncharacterized protein n=1 Tax=uncultured Caudovirales phage TaxID=2100421 RepID=A0A6J5KXP2_9CAUD|nr:hypothetical protein UFOVP54_23 [uncultured Caudovirales phage]